MSSETEASSIRAIGWNRISIKFPLLGIVMIGLSLSVLAWLLYQDTRSNLESSISRELVGIAATGALMIDPDMHEDIFLLDDGAFEGGEAFNRIKKTLLVIQARNRLTKPIYTLRQTPDFDDTQEMEFVVMTDLDSDGRAYVGNRIAITPYVQQVYETGESVATSLYTDIEGTWLSAIAPIKDADGEVIAVLSIDRDVQFFEEALKRVRGEIFGTAGVSLLAAGILFYVLTLPLVRRIRSLMRGTETVSEGNLDHRIEIRGTDELGLLADSFNQMIESLSSTVVSRDYVENIIQSMIEVLLVIQPKGRIGSVNQATQLLLGYSEDELVGRQIGLIFGDEETFPLKHAEMEQLNRDGFIRNVEKVLHAKDGRQVPVLFSGSVMRGENDRIDGIVCVAQDITERKRAERAVMESKEELEVTNQQLKQTQVQMAHSEKMAGLGQMAAGVAHEINNPVGFIMSNLGTMKEYVETFRQLLMAYGKIVEAVRDRDSAALKSNLEEVNKLLEEEDLDFVMEDVDQLLQESSDGADRVKDIVLGLRNFARLDEAEVKEADINEGIESTLKVIWNELKYKCEVHTHLGELPPLTCHPAQLNQVFMNLLTNAAQAIEEKGEITISTEATDECIVVRISDTGKGIPEENIGKLFDPFFTTKAVGEGTGLGLAIAHGIVEKHKGTIEVESEVGVGTTFIIMLPLEGVQNE